MNDYNFEQIIKVPTRCTNISSSLIDCIFTNIPHLSQISGVYGAGISDHDLIYVSRKRPKSKKSETKIVELRCFKNTNYDDMRKMISSAPYWIFGYCKDVNEKYNMFHEILKRTQHTRTTEES